MNPTQKTFDLVHFGTDCFDFNKVQPVRNREFIKPHGGLWASPIDSEYGWKDWCIDNDFALDRMTKSVRLRFTGNTLTIDNEADLELLAWKPIPGLSRFCSIDFEKHFLDGIEAIHLTADGEQATRWSHPRSLYGWDCESVLVLNPAGLTVLHPQHA